MITVSLEVKGLDQALARLSKVERNIRGLSAQTAFGDAMSSLHRFAVSISPVVTGAYQGSHRLVVSRMTATLSIDPAARNPVSGESVERYAAAVEERHNVYGRTAAEAERMADKIAKDILREVVK